MQPSLETVIDARSCDAGPVEDELFLIAVLLDFEYS